MMDTTEVVIRSTPPDGEVGRTLFVYRDGGRKPVFYVERPADAGDFARPQLWGPTPDGARWQSNLKNVPRPLPLYRLNTLTKNPLPPVVFHRGEREVYRATVAGLAGIHTTTVMGTGYVRASDLAPLAGRQVLICPDDSEDGERYADEVAALAREAGAQTVEVLRLLDRLTGQGIGGWLDRGGTSEQWAGLLSAHLSTADTEPHRQGGTRETVFSRTAASPRPLPETPTDAFRPPTPLPQPPAAGRLFSKHLLPPVLHDFCADIAERTGAPPDFPGTALLVALGSVVGRGLGIHALGGDSRVVIPNLWGALLTERATSMFTGAVGEALAPLGLLSDRARKECDRWEGGPGAGPPRKRRYRTGTASVPTLVGLMNDNPRGVLLVRDDLVGWMRSLSRPRREGELHFYLSCWSGTEPGSDFDTPSGESVFCKSPCLSMLGWARTAAFRNLLAGGGPGPVLSRFQLTVCGDGSGGNPSPERNPDRAARQAVERLFEYLDPIGRAAAPEGRPAPALEFDGDARHLYEEWRRTNRTKLDAQPGPGMEACLSALTETMPALALIFHLVQHADGVGDMGPVGEDEVRRAILWCDHLETHARHLHGVRSAPELTAAHRLLNHLVRGELASPFKLRDVYRRHWSGLANKNVAQAALQQLEHHGYLVSQPLPTTKKGGKPTRLFYLNPVVGEERLP